ncbi:hypothetical protein F441_21840 [Phytophthora nicotianae CJ01A1]|uniref:Uncharacterized protein n=4 Tax=Phytophthora nicotianae TaxID=4792 RepID=W2Y2T1_PHYNI|nr:hypothetical protein L915_21350 [Phytophthora nicotianae]ETO59723.1 hypothetical protein F444_21974 [Phytophthora nicotianae P1976]ETP00813.1 hypothetical protein F441_21840 [Phytophthora nicotianae CJ01A1]ETP28958.1 hypothetical protein F442_21818 [Phytophthora nicotianae P10297]
MATSQTEDIGCTVVVAPCNFQACDWSRSPFFNVELVFVPDAQELTPWL